MSNAPLRIFMVEDDKLIAIAVTDMLHELGFEIAATATTIPDALRKMNSCDFEIALLDVNVNGMNCFVVAEALRQRGLPIAFASGYGPAALREDMRDYPIATKPFTIDELKSVLSRALSPALRKSHDVATGQR